MKVASLKLKNFKRFTDLLIRDIPKTAKLVVVVGPNGCGKSSLFDALLHWYRLRAEFGINDDSSYFLKDRIQAPQWGEIVDVTLHDGGHPKKGSLYIRTAYRNDPDFSVNGIDLPPDPSKSIRVNRVIDNDQTVSDNYRRLVYDTMASVYNEGNDTKTVRVLREELIGEVRDSMKRVFGDLLLNSISDPLGAGAFYFAKGVSKSYHYKNLSGGEKAAFDLLLDVHVKRRFFPDAIYCIDEIETHLHTRVQGTLLKEIVRVLPDTCQLWVTTHSLGVLRAAQEMMVDEPASVCLLDFNDIDPDVPREIVPSSLGRVTWEKLLSVTLDDLSSRLAPRNVVICEGSSVGTRRKDFDAEVYNRILGSQNADVLFVSGGSCNQVNATGIAVKDAMERILPSSKFCSLVDRDDKSDAESAAMEAQGTVVLPLRNLESYLFSDDVIDALLAREGKSGQRDAALAIKQTAIDESVKRGNAPDDLKSAGGDIYTGLKKLLGLHRCGNTTEAFMRDTLAPLITPTMPTYLAMKTAILDKLP